MAGTIVKEHGIVYKSLYESIKNNGIDIEQKDINNWHGMMKMEIITHFVQKYCTGSQANLDILKMKINKDFQKIL